MQNEPLDVIALLVVLITYVTSREVASLLGPYAAIIVSASAGAAVSLPLRSSAMDQWWQPMGYIIVRVMLAVLLTVALANVVHVYVPDLQLRVLLVPISIGIGLVWDYGAVLKWGGNALKKALPAWLTNLGRRNG